MIETKSKFVEHSYE